MLTETARVIGIVAILFLTGTLRALHGHGRAVRGNLLEVFARTLFALATVAVIVTADMRLDGESPAPAVAWAAFIVLLPMVITPWVRARRLGPVRVEVHHAFTRAVQMSLSTGLLIWVFLVLTGRSGRLLDLRLFIAAAIAAVGALKLARLARVPLPPEPQEPADPEPDRVPVGS